MMTGLAKITIKPARRVEAMIPAMAAKGRLQRGADADVVVFDPATVAPGPLRRVRDFPADAERLTADQPSGVHVVLVNGTPVVKDGALVEAGVAARPGVRPTVV